MPIAQVNESKTMSLSQEKIDISLLAHPSSYGKCKFLFKIK